MGLEEFFKAERKRWENFIQCDLAALNNSQRLSYQEAMRDRDKAEVCGDIDKWREHNRTLFIIATAARNSPIQIDKLNSLSAVIKGKNGECQVANRFPAGVMGQTLP